MSAMILIVFHVENVQNFVEYRGAAPSTLDSKQGTWGRLPSQ